MADRPKLAFCSIAALDRPLAAVAELAARLGLDGLEVTARPPHLDPDPGGPLLPGGSLEQGVLDYRAILAAVFEAGYAGPLAIEFLSHDPRPLEEKLAEDVAFLRCVLAELGRA